MGLHGVRGLPSLHVDLMLLLLLCRRQLLAGRLRVRRQQLRHSCGLCIGKGVDERGMLRLPQRSLLHLERLLGHKHRQARAQEQVGAWGGRGRDVSRCGLLDWTGVVGPTSSRVLGH